MQSAMKLLLVFCAFGPNSAAAASIRGAPALQAKSEKNQGAVAVAEKSAPTPVAPPDAHMLLAKTVSQGDVSCGKLDKFDNAEPKNYDDAMATKFNEETKKREPVTFKAGDVIDFKCKMGFTLDGSKDGDKEFKVTCADQGYFKPDGVCMKAGKCGKPPSVPHATATPKIIPGKVQFKCNPGYSLDGEKVVAGGMGKNTLFTLECIDFSGKYEKFGGECKPYAFVPSKESTQIYTDVFEALFVVTCKGKVQEAFGKGKSPPVDSACGKLKSASASGPCSSLVSEIKAKFEARKKDVEKYEKGKEWWEGDGKPSIGPDATTFCTNLWKLVEKPNDL